MNPDWDHLLSIYLHDPPGKALDIRGHEKRAAELTTIALGEEVNRRSLHEYTRTEDILTSTLECVVPLPTAGNGVRAVSVEAGQLRITHPLSGGSLALGVSELQSDLQAEKQTLSDIVDSLDPARARALAIWRLWRDRLVKRNEAWGRLPADTRLPDHTIWNHIDAAMGCAGATRQHGVGLLMFSLGPVQPFIAAARTVRDLWSGSYILSWLTFSAMRPVLEECGPAAIISPALRGNPLMDHWLRQLPFNESPGAPCLLRAKIEPPHEQQLLSPCLPNRFSAFVPSGKEGEKVLSLAQQCEQACRDAWLSICQRVRHQFSDKLLREGIPHCDGWDRLWDSQVKSFFEMRTAALPINACTDDVLGPLLSKNGQLRETLPHAFNVRALESAIPGNEKPGYRQDSAGQWMAVVDLLGRLMAAQRTLRPLPDYDPPSDAQGRWPGKCSLMGTYEQLGPARREEADPFWEGVARRARIEGASIREGERLCAISLVKRWAWGAYFSNELELPVDALRYPDTATVAARIWLRHAAIEPDRRRDQWSGQWLHWSRRDEDEEEAKVPEALWARIREHRAKKKPPAYYAILMLDGDHLGKWLRGDKAPAVDKALHPRLVDYFGALAGTAAGLKARRPFGPAMQAALSEALTNFALHFVPSIVEEHDGTLIYSGGDDVLALLPTEKALACAGKLASVFQKDWEVDSTKQTRLLMGSRATVSAGLAVVHYKEDLRIALHSAREAEKQAKSAGRDCLCVRVVRRSGEDSSAVVDWKQVDALQDLVKDFQNGTSDRWAYRLRHDLTTFAPLPAQAFDGELRRLLDRIEGRSDEFRDRVMQFWRDYQNRWPDCPKVREDMVALCQSASFLARGRDQ